jgi:hypothetical protein
MNYKVIREAPSFLGVDCNRVQAFQINLLYLDFRGLHKFRAEN